MALRFPRVMRLPFGLAAPLALLLTALPAMAAGPALWGEGPMEKIRPGTPPRVKPEVSLTAARNEFVSFQVGLHGGDSGLRGVRARLPALVGPTVLTGPLLTLYRQDFLTTHQASVPGEETGRWPDALVPEVDELAGEPRTAFPFDVPAGEARALWVDVLVPLDAPPGEYHGTVEVTAEGFRQDLSVRLTVVDAHLPSTPSLATSFLLWPPHVCRAHFGRPDCSREELTPLLVRYQRLALEHRLTLSSAFPRLPGQATWDVPDWDFFDATWGPLLDGTAPSRLPGARMTSVQYLGADTPEALTDFTAHFRERGWLPRAFAYLGDEPPFWTPWEEVHTRARLMRQVAPELRTLLTTALSHVEAQGLEDAVDLVTPVVNHLSGTEPPFLGEHYADFLSRPGRALWLYQSCASHGCFFDEDAYRAIRPGPGWPSYMVDRSAAKGRAMQWVLFLAGASTELYYQTVGMLASAWEDQYRYSGNGDGTLFYPGTPDRVGGTTHVPVASLRLKLIRLGVQDHEWLKLVSDAGDPDFARQVARELIPAPSQVSDDGEAFERARLRLLHRYLELTRASPGPPEAVTGGCSTSGGTSALAALLCLGTVALAVRRRRRAA